MSNSVALFTSFFVFSQELIPATTRTAKISVAAFFMGGCFYFKDKLFFNICFKFGRKRLLYTDKHSGPFFTLPFLNSRCSSMGRAAILTHSGVQQPLIF